MKNAASNYGGLMDHPGLMKTEEEVVELLAALEHERWSGWEKYRARCTENGAGVPFIDKAIARWRRQRETAYADLSEKEKESDRVEARKTLALLRRLEVLTFRE